MTGEQSVLIRGNPDSGHFSQVGLLMGLRKHPAPKTAIGGPGAVLLRVGLLGKRPLGGDGTGIAGWRHSRGLAWRSHRRSPGRGRSGPGEQGPLHKHSRTIPSGQSVTWHNPDSGKQRGCDAHTDLSDLPAGQYCREYQQTIIIRRREAPILWPTACRQPDGSWKMVS